MDEWRGEARCESTVLQLSDLSEPGVASLGVSNGVVPHFSSLSLFWLDFSSPVVSKVPLTCFPTAPLLPFSPHQCTDVCSDLELRLFGLSLLTLRRS